MFRFTWFQPVWFYDPTLSFPSDRLILGYFLVLAENISDGFTYIVLPDKEYKDIPTHRNPETLVRYIVVSQYLTSSCIPRCIKYDGGFKFFNSGGSELIGEE